MTWDGENRLTRLELPDGVGIMSRGGGQQAAQE